MPLLSATQRDQIRFSLGYTSEAVPFGDSAILEDRLAKTYTTDQITAITRLIERIERVFVNSEMNQQVGGVLYNRVIVGDVNRTDREDRAEPYSRRRRAYIHETDRLALYFGVRNYVNPENQPYLRYGTIQL